MRTESPSPRSAAGGQASRASAGPRLYDLLVLVLTRGRGRAYREDLLDLAGDPDERKTLVAKHGAHRRFDLESLREALSDAGFEEVEGDPLEWLGLHFLRGTKIEGRRAGGGIKGEMS